MVELVPEDDAGARPGARAFAWRLPAGTGAAGILAAGLDADGVVEDAWTLLAPALPAGTWR